MTTRSPAFDIDAYIASLPSYRLREPRIVPPLYQESRWPLLKPYNGFSGAERRRGGQLIGWLQAAGCLPRPTRCDICGSRERVGSHSETYAHVLRAPALCTGCHRALHLRPWQWEAWRRIVDRAAVTGREWFVLAPRYGIDIGQHLRDRWGATVMDIENSPVSPLPDAITALLPGNMFPHPDVLNAALIR